MAVLKELTPSIQVRLPLVPGRVGLALCSMDHHVEHLPLGQHSPLPTQAPRTLRQYCASSPIYKPFSIINPFVCNIRYALAVLVCSSSSVIRSVFIP